MDSAGVPDMEAKLQSFGLETRPLTRHSRTMSTSIIEVGSTGPVKSLMVKEKEAPKLRSSKSMVWREPKQLFEKITGVQSTKMWSTSFRQPQSKGDAVPRLMTDPSRQSAWTRFWKRFRIDRGKKVHAEWLNYDAQSYAMNFETDKEAEDEKSVKQMPKISGPGAREIVTVLLRRSSSANRNSGCILIPRPVFRDRLAIVPLWKRRSIKAPSSLDTKPRKFVPTYRRRSNVV